VTGPGATGAAGAPAVGVTLATRDRFGLLARALDAIWAQSYAGPIDVVVVVDGDVPDRLDLPEPADPSRQSLTVQVNQRTPGLCGARNTALDLVAADLLATCDDDDVWMPDRLAVQVAELEAHPDAVAVGGSIRIVRGETHVVRRAPMAEAGLDDLLADRIMELHPSAMLYRREALEKAQGWDESLPGGYAEDYDLLLRLARLGPLRLVHEVVADIEWNGGSYFFGRWRTIADALTELLRRYPEFEREPRGRARIEGQIAFAHAALGERGEARRWMRAAWRDRRGEPRVGLTALVLSRVVSADRIQATLHARGRGI
jgi:glycosyltransferase involved in cell wall biosynthesis